MMIKFLSQSINGSTGFKIKVKGIFPNQLCYKLSDGGTSYRGTLNYTQNYKPCLAWDKVRHCPYNTFDIRSVGSGIAGNNYCRNPSMITQPWCYIDADECIQDMCDACVLDRCHDVYDDCAENMALDSAYCNADPNAFTGCHFSCGFCKTPDPVISCSNPPISESAIFIGPIKTVYAVGDVVEYECKKSGIKGGMRRTCLGDGTWSYASSQCSGCKTGYEEFDGRCYKLYPEFLNFQEASTKCQTDDPLYYPAAICNLKKKVFIDEFIERHGDPTRWLHTGIIVEDEGKLKCTDGTDFILMADWVPWYSDTVPILLAGNVIINIKNAWQPQSMTYKASVVCEGKTPGEMKCSDRQSDCQQQLKMNPDVCLNAIDFKQTQCRWSCGVCKDTQNPGKPCTAPPTFGNATLNGMKTSLYLGETAQYTCNGGYAKQEGDLKRVCLADGSLGGTDPQCVGDDEMAYKIGKDHIYLQDKEDTSGSMNIDASMKVPRTSKPVAYIFYSKYAGQLAFQVWRKIGTYTFKLIGENTVTTKEDRQMYVKIAPEKQIRMQKGDYIGWKNLNRRNAPLTYVNCVKKFMPNYKDTFYQIPDAYRKSFPESANFNLMVGECRNYSLQIIAHPFSGAGFLSNIEAVCDVPSVPNAKVSHPQIGVPEGTEVSITCLPSYTATTGATKITCLKSGLWSAAHVQCYEPKNTTDSTACVFPFIVNGASHLDCVGFPPWCATTANHDEDQKAGLCQLECKSPTGNKQPGQSWTFQDKRYFCDEGATIQLIPAPEKTVDGYDCVFPWKYHDAYYGTCYLSNQENRLWCSLTADYDKDKKYNYCGVTCTAQNGTRVHAGDSWKHEGLSYFCNEESKIILIPEPEVKAAVEGKVCGFPYFFKEKWWGTCNMIGADKPWCSLNSGDYSVKKEWAYCKTACYNQNGTRVYAGDSWEHEDLRYFCNEESKIMPIPEPEVKTAVEGKVCGFPYFYNDKWWGTCNMFSADKPWCSLNSGNYYDTREWAYCKMRK